MSYMRAAMWRRCPHSPTPTTSSSTTSRPVCRSIRPLISGTASLQNAVLLVVVVAAEVCVCVCVCVLIQRACNSYADVSLLFVFRTAAGTEFLDYGSNHAGLGVWDLTTGAKFSVQFVSDNFVGALLPTLTSDGSSSSTSGYIFFNNTGSIVYTDPLQVCIWEGIFCVRVCV
jgi:hypothetical protein